MTTVSDQAQSDVDGPEQPSQDHRALPLNHIRPDSSRRQQSKNHTTMSPTVQCDPTPSSPSAATPIVKGTPRLNLDNLVVQPPIKPRDFAMPPSAPGSETPSATDSPSPSESESWSVPSTRPPSQVPSRAPSVSAGIPGNKPFVLPPSSHQQQFQQQRRPSTSSLAPPTAMQPAQNPRSRAPTAPSSPQPPSTPVRARASSNAQSDSSRFSLANLIASAPKLNRKSSGRSIGSSRKSDSDGERKSVAGESGVSLTQKYGVCQKVAIGKGATSVVRLAHKWDRTEEKLYAVKVSPARSCLSPPFILLHGSKYAYHSSSSLRSSGSVARTNLKKNTSRSLRQSSASPPHCIMSTSSRPLILSRTRTRRGARSWSFALAGTYMLRSRKGTCHRAKSSAVSSKY